TKYPDGNNETRTYDNVGNMLTKKDPNGNLMSYGYDALNRLANETYPDSSRVTITYDKASNRLSVSNPSATVYYKYDARNRSYNETDVIGSSTFKLIYTFDLVGNVLNMMFPSGYNQHTLTIRSKE